MKRVLILGGGFGGVAAAYRLKQVLEGSDEVLLVDRRPYFMMGLRKTWGLVDAAPLEAGQRPLNRLSRIGVQVLNDAVTKIEPGARAIVVGGRRIEADALVVALGAETAPQALPGLAENSINVYDPAEIRRAAESLREMKQGKLAIGVFGIPYKCPPAPYEMALLSNEYLRSKHLQVNVEVFTPQPMSLPVLGQAGCDVIESRLAENGVTFLPNHKATAVEPGQVLFGDRQRPFDLLFAVPPHRPPAVVRESGLAGDSGWVWVDPQTLETHFAGVYAIGDVVEIAMANGKPLPKAGVFAEAMGVVVAERIAAQFAGEESGAKFTGEGGCYLEVGAGQAMMVRGNFLAEPEPEVTLTEAAPRYWEEKRAFEAQRLEKWFA
jgi:sulfide:quinone oxidoreductase